MHKCLYLLLLIAILLESCVKDNLVTPQTQFKRDTLAISKFLKGIAATKDPSGYWYVIDTLAAGVYPSLSDSVKISYGARLISDSGLDLVDSVALTTVLLSGTISGIQQGLLKFPSGSYGRLFLPSGLAFGASAHITGASNVIPFNVIPPNSNLAYEIKLISVKGTRLASDIATIDTYLQSSSILPVKDQSGIRYVLSIDSAAVNPQKPLPGDDIQVSYMLRVLKGVDTLALITSPGKLVALNDQIPAWKIILPKIAEGDSISMYVPAGFGYGSIARTIAANGDSSKVSIVPANSNLEYRLKLVKVIHH